MRPSEFASAVPPRRSAVLKPPKPARFKPSRAPRLSIKAWRQFMEVARPFWMGDQKKVAWSLLGVLLILMLADTQLAVLLNNTSGEMTSALAARDSPRFWASVKESLIVVAFAVPVYAFYYYMRDTFSNRWRRWLTSRFVQGYLSDRRYYTLNQQQDIDNPDQRISEDINTFTGRSIHFALIFIGSFMQLVAFSAVLWSISKMLVAFLSVYAVVGTVVALQVFGSPLIRLNFWQLRREADFRFGLMRLRENAECIAFYRGEKQEHARIQEGFDQVYRNYERLIRKQRALNLFQRGFSQLTLVVPSVILAQGVLSGELEVGRAVQAAGAFAAVLSAVAVIVDNFESLSRFVAGIDRLHTLSRCLLPTLTSSHAPVEQSGPPARTVQRGANAQQHSSPQTKPDLQGSIRTQVGKQLGLASLTLSTPQSDRILIKDLNLNLASSESLLITGASGCGKSSLLRAIAGLWQTGTGLVCHPPLEDVFFLPQHPYLQTGTLRSQLIYPATTPVLDDARLLAILAEVQLPDLAERMGGLDAVHDWGKLLSMGEQQRLAFARVLVHAPKMAILDEATSALDSRNEALLYKRLRDTGATLVSIAHRPGVLRFHTHVLELQGNGAWALHKAEHYRFEDMADAAPEPSKQVSSLAVETASPVL